MTTPAPKHTSGPKVSPAMLKALKKAASREHGNICPVIGVHAAAEDVLIEALDKRGFITWDGGEAFKGAPRINEAGRAAIARAEGK